MYETGLLLVYVVELFPSLTMASAKNTPEVVATPKTVIGEGPHWKADEEALYYVDILGKRILRYDQRTGANEEIAVKTEENLNYASFPALIKQQKSPNKKQSSYTIVQ